MPEEPQEISLMTREQLIAALDRATYAGDRLREANKRLRAENKKLSEGK